MRKSLKDTRVGFVVSHPYHMFIYGPIINALDNPVVFVETRRGTPFNFSNDFFESLQCPYVVLDEKELKKADQQVDVIFVMTPKHMNAQFKHARTVLMQYGMAKEYYNYGLWRSRADLNMMYGPYSTNKIENFAVARSVGYTRLDGYTPPKLGGGGLVYLPTYGELSSLGNFLEALPSFNPEVPIKIKLHHASEFSDKELLEKLSKYERVTILDGYENSFDALAEADVVISDYSGAIFDALFLNRPLALFQPGFQQTVIRTNEKSIEVKHGEKFGEILNNKSELIDFVERFAQGQTPEIKNYNDMQLLSNPGKAVPVVLDCLEKLINNEMERSIVQESLRDTYVRLLTQKPKQVTIGIKKAIRNRLKKMLRLK